MKTAPILGLFASILLGAGCASNPSSTVYYPSPPDGQVLVPPTRDTAASPRSNDRVLAESVRQQFSRYGELASFTPNVQVSAQNGVVTLTGSVPSETDRKMIEGMVGHTAGVTAAVNDLLQVGASPSSNTADSFESKIRQDLRSNRKTARVADYVGIENDDGIITLTGVVPSEEDRRLVEDQVGRTPGVVIVNDDMNIGLEPTGRSGLRAGEVFRVYAPPYSAPDQGLAQRIVSELRVDKDLALLLPAVDISVERGAVFLKGTVQNGKQKTAIVSAAKGSSGTAEVVDELQIQPPQ